MDSKSSKTHTIYVELLDEGTLVWRPVKAILVDKNIYKILTSNEYDPDDEVWKFKPGSLVECKWETKNGEKLLIAQNLISNK